MNKADLLELMEHARRKTEELLAAVAAAPDPAGVLSMRPAPGRAHIAWQLMHVAATDDRHLNVRMKSGEPASADHVRRFAGGSVPDDAVPTLDEIRRYLADSRKALLDHLRGLSEADLPTKPTPAAQWTYHEWFKVLAWHEAHHHGQCQLTFNIYRALHDPKLAKVGH